LLSTLSAGPVGIGDRMGSESKTNLLKAVRADGVIVKPDAPIVPLDQTYVADARNEREPLTASTFTEHEGINTEYLFAYDRGGASSRKIDFNLSELGLNRPAYVYDYFSQTAKRLNPKDAFTAQLEKKAYAFYVVAPVGKSGVAFLGDKDKFVGTGKQRIASLRDEPSKLTVGVVLASGEKSVVLHGYAAKAPKATVLTGVDDDLQFDPATGYFTIEVKADSTSPADDSSGDPVRKVTVVFETPRK
jgi:hypothetical protein